MPCRTQCSGQQRDAPVPHPPRAQEPPGRSRQPLGQPLLPHQRCRARSPQHNPRSGGLRRGAYPSVIPPAALLALLAPTGWLAMTRVPCWPPSWGQVRTVEVGVRHQP
jgi:hypothetical protein